MIAMILMMGVGVAGILPPNFAGLLMYVGRAKLGAVAAAVAPLLVACSGSSGWFVLCAAGRTISLPT